MPRPDQRYAHHQHGQGGYDEDWDDDVYYAAVSRPGSGGSGAGAGGNGNGAGDNRGDEGSKGAARGGRDRTPSKRHYMKVPNMRQLRAMRSTAEGFSAGPRNPSDRHSSSPRASLGARLDTDMATSSSGDGSLPLLPHLGQSSPPPSSPPGGWEGEGDAVAADRDQDWAQDQGRGQDQDRDGAASVEDMLPASPGASAPTDSSSAGRTEGQEHSEEADVVGRGGESIVHLRGSPRSVESKGRASAAARVHPASSASPGGSPSSTKGLSAFAGQGHRTARSSPVAGGCAAAGGFGSALGGKRRRGSVVGVGQRFGAGAWPRLPGEDSPPPKVSRRSLGFGTRGREQKPLQAAARSPRLSGMDSEAEGHEVALASWRQIGAKDRAARGQNGGREFALQQHRDRDRDRDRHQPPTSGSSSSSLSATPTQRPSGNPPSEVGRGGSRGGENESADGRRGGGSVGGARGAFLRDRPARWGGKGGMSSTRSPLRSPGAPPKSESSAQGAGGSGIWTMTPTDVAPLGRSQSGRTVRRGKGAPQSSAGEDVQGPTFKLTSVFQATPSSSSRARSAWEKHGNPGGRRGPSSRYPLLRGGHPNSGGTPAATFDPTRMGVAAVPVEEAEEVEDADSDDQRERNASFENDDVDGVTAWLPRCDAVQAMSEPGGDWSGVTAAASTTACCVDDFEDKPLGEDVAGEAVALPGGARQPEGGRAAAGMETVSDQADSPPTRWPPAVAQPDEIVTTKNNEGSVSGGRREGATPNAAGKSPSVDNDAPGARGSVPNDGHGMPAGHPARPDVSPPPHQGMMGITAVRSGGTPAGNTERQQQQQRDRQQQLEGLNSRPKAPSPPPRTPIRRPSFSPSSFGRGPPSSASAAGTASGGHGKWRPSFGSGGDGSAGRSPGAMHAPGAVFSTPARGGGGGGVPLSGAASVSGRKRKGAGAGNGPLGRLMQQIRARYDGDEARLLSGEFPFRLAPTPTGKDAPGSARRLAGGGGGGFSRRDHGDPRTRCSVAVDVTILAFGAGRGGAGSSSAVAGGGGAGGGGGERDGGAAGLVRFPCLVHAVVDVSARPTGGRRARATDDTVLSSSSLERLRLLEGGTAEVLFKRDTRRALDVCPGSRLRIYDPCCASRAGGEGETELLMCTQLCEPYPSCLPPLAVPDAFRADGCRRRDPGEDSPGFDASGRGLYS